jgi:hypothetical protein
MLKSHKTYRETSTKSQRSVTYWMNQINSSRLKINARNMRLFPATTPKCHFKKVENTLTQIMPRETCTIKKKSTSPSKNFQSRTLPTCSSLDFTCKRSWHKRLATHFIHRHPHHIKVLTVKFTTQDLQNCKYSTEKSRLVSRRCSELNKCTSGHHLAQSTRF